MILDYTGIKYVDSLPRNARMPGIKKDAIGGVGNEEFGSTETRVYMGSA